MSVSVERLKGDAAGAGAGAGEGENRRWSDDADDRELVSGRGEAGVSYGRGVRS